MLALPLLRLMATDHAAGCRAEEPMMGGVMSCDAADKSPFDAAFRIGGGSAQRGDDQTQGDD